MMRNLMEVDQVSVKHKEEDISIIRKTKRFC
jgi:hypothetical protein